jgi:molecular chaperone GrpE
MTTDPQTADPAADTDPAALDLTVALDAAQKEAAELKDKYLRAVAEMQNIQKRAQRDIDDAGKYGVISAAKPFLSVADNLARALAALPAEKPAHLKNFFDGIDAISRELHSALSRMGVVPLSVAVGDALNPHEHEVMFEIPTDEQKAGTIMQILEMGYKIHDRLLRPARVAIAKNTGTASAPNAMDVPA